MAFRSPVYFLDNNILAFANPSTNYKFHQKLVSFVERNQGLFFCTETVRTEYLRRWDKLPTFVTFVDSQIDLGLQQTVCNEILQNLFEKEVSREHASIFFKRTTM
eukprot:TRINITY_DN8713_c0_g1_i11.p1 TRINITY_DN8713_c0_g1~~TRINITY_DN8713_c0_g1_i11.p1  ORF type:complete len:105 (-),score=2.88 TRINITY_DN8713_c0_g1_i11:247-561(-)